YDVIRLHKPDVVFLDVHIHNFTGFDLLQKFDRIDFDVVFATAFERYAIQAIKFSAADYLMKPIDPDDLVDAITRIQQKNKKDQTDFNLLFENVTNMKNHIRKIVVPTQDELLFLNIDDIIRCKSDINYTTIFLKNKTTVFVAK